MQLTYKFQNLYSGYPRQFWLMITGIMLATAGGSMIWPFMLIYASGKLALPLSTVAALLSINAGTPLPRHRWIPQHDHIAPRAIWMGGLLIGLDQQPGAFPPQPPLRPSPADSPGTVAGSCLNASSPPRPFRLI